MLYSERKVIIYRKLMIQLDKRCSVSSHHGIPVSVIQEKNLNCQVHQDMKLYVGIKTNSNSKTIYMISNAIRNAQ